jgi:hypothetical protein
VVVERTGGGHGLPPELRARCRNLHHRDGRRRGELSHAAGRIDVAVRVDGDGEEIVVGVRRAVHGPPPHLQARRAVELRDQAVGVAKARIVHDAREDDVAVPVELDVERHVLVVRAGDAGAPP